MDKNRCGRCGKVNDEVEERYSFGKTTTASIGKTTNRGGDSIMKKETEETRIKKIPKAVKKRFKAACALRGVGMNDRLIKLMQQDAEAAERADLRAKAKGKEG